MDTRILPITLALWTLATRAEIYFVNPPRFGTVGDFSSNAVYTIGQNLRVQWSDAPENTGISVLLYQLNNTEYMLPGQYLFQNVVNTTIYDWTVAVSENLPATLDESNLFYLSVFQEGKVSSDSNSHYFNITAAKSTATSTSSTIDTSSTSAALSTGTQTGSSSSASTSGPSTTTESTASQPSSGSNTDLSTGTKIGIGVGIPAAAIIGIGAGWFFFGRRRRQQANAPGSREEPRYSSPPIGPDHRAGSTSVSEYWAPSGHNSGSLYYKQADPPREQFIPQVYEASGESRVTEPAELYTEPPNPRYLAECVLRNPAPYAQLASEVRTTFASAGEIRHGKQLTGRKFLRAVIDESLRISPPTPGVMWREKDPLSIEPLIVDGHVIPPGTLVDVGTNSLMHNPEYFPEPFIFRPQRWLEGDEDTPEDKEARATMRRAFIPFILGDRACAGKAVVYLEISLTVVKTMWSFDFEKAPGTAGELGSGRWGAARDRDRPDEYQLYDRFMAEHEGPNLKFRPREN